MIIRRTPAVQLAVLVVSIVLAAAPFAVVHPVQPCADGQAVPFAGVADDCSSHSSARPQTVSALGRSAMRFTTEIAINEVLVPEMARHSGVISPAGRPDSLPSIAAPLPPRAPPRSDR